MNGELSTEVMSSLIKNKALAGSTWKSKRLGITYKIVGYGLDGNDVIIHYRFYSPDYTGNLGWAFLQRKNFLRNYELVKPI